MIDDSRGDRKSHQRRTTHFGESRGRSLQFTVHIPTLNDVRGDSPRLGLVARALTQPLSESAVRPVRRSLIRILAGCAMLFLPTVLQSQGLAPAARKAIADSVRGRMRSYADTFRKLDAVALLAFLQASADFRFIGDMTPATYGQRQREASQQPFAAVRSGDVRFDSVLVNVLTETVAVATGFAIGTWTLKSGAVHRFREVGTFVWVRDAAGWKLAHAQNVEREEPPAAKRP